MKRLLLIGTAAVGGGLLVRRAIRGCSGFDFEKMIERMPAGAPPKWMFTNISAIRQNTDRILELVESEHAEVADRPTRSAA